jgi:hypothetical protein
MLHINLPCISLIQNHQKCKCFLKEIFLLIFHNVFLIISEWFTRDTVCWETGKKSARHPQNSVHFRPASGEEKPFVFCGTKDSQYQQVGNAVPPILAKAIAEHLAAYLDK